MNEMIILSALRSKDQFSYMEQGILHIWLRFPIAKGRGLFQIAELQVPDGLYLQSMTTKPPLEFKGYYDVIEGAWYPRETIEQILIPFCQDIEDALYDLLEEQFEQLEALPARAQDVRQCRLNTIHCQVPELEEELRDLCTQYVRISADLEEVRNHLEDYADSFLRNNTAFALRLAEKIADHLPEDFWTEAAYCKGREEEYTRLEGKLAEQQTLYLALSNPEDAPFKIVYKNNATRTIEAYEELLVEHMVKITGKHNKVVWKEGQLVKGKKSYYPDLSRSSKTHVVFTQAPDKNVNILMEGEENEFNPLTHSQKDNADQKTLAQEVFGEVDFDEEGQAVLSNRGQSSASSKRGKKHKKAERDLEILTSEDRTLDARTQAQKAAKATMAKKRKRKAIDNGSGVFGELEEHDFGSQIDVSLSPEDFATSNVSSRRKPETKIF